MIFPISAFSFIIIIPYFLISNFNCEFIDKFQMAKELVNSAPLLMNEIKSGSFDANLGIEWINKHSFAVLCVGKFEEEIDDKNLQKLRKYFCDNLPIGTLTINDDDNVRELVKKVQIDEKSIDKNAIVEKIAKDSILSKQNKGNFKEFFDKLIIGIQKATAVIKAKNHTFSRQTNNRRLNIRTKRGLNEVVFCCCVSIIYIVVAGPLIYYSVKYSKEGNVDVHYKDTYGHHYSYKLLTEIIWLAIILFILLISPPLLCLYAFCKRP